MGYVSAKFPESPTVSGIYTVFHRDIGLTSPTRVDVHDFPEIFYVRRGVSHTLVDGVEYEISAGQIIVYAPNSPHVGARPSDVSVSIVSFDADHAALAPLYNRPITLTSMQKKMLSSVIDDGCRCFAPRDSVSEERGMILRADADGYLIQRMKRGLELFLVELLAAVAGSRKGSDIPKDYTEVLSYLESNICSRLTVAEIARATNMSISKLKYLFRDVSGGGVIDAFNNMKIDRAKRLISEGKHNFTEISDMLAFSSLHYFSRLFKRVTGVSPSEYKKAQIEKRGYYYD